MKTTNRRTENTVTFTTTWLSKLKPPAAGRDVYHDAQLPGFCLRITADGMASYSVYKKLRKKPVRVTIGRADQVNLKQARELAAVALGQIAAGINPNEAKQEQRAQDARENTTLGGLWAYYLEHHAKRHKRSWREDEKRYLRHLAKWAEKPLDDITQSKVDVLLDTIGKDAPYEANRTRALLSVMFAFGFKPVPDRDWPGFDGHNPAHGTKRFEEEQRGRFLQPDEMPVYRKAIDEMRFTNPVVADLFDVALLTGARRGNVRDMLWEELELQRGEWIIPKEKYKGKRATVVYLPPEAVEIIQRRQQTAGKNPYVFRSPRLPNKPVQDVYKPWKAMLKATGLKDFRPHDLRRSQGAYQTAAGTPIQTIGKALGHRPGSSATAVYARADLSAVKAAVDKANAAMQAAATAGQTTGKPEGK